MSTVRPKEITVGPDRVFFVDDMVVILAARAMRDWTVREFCIPAIYFQEKKYFLKRKQPVASPYAFRYELAPWTPELGSESPRSICYDADYVSERDRQFGTSRRQDHLYAALFLFFPFFGLCWSRFKRRVLAPIGFDALATTEASVILSFAFFLLEALFVVSFRAGFLGIVMGSMPMVWVDRVLFALLPLDCLVRYGSVLRGDAAPPGFLEWIFRREKPETTHD